MASDNAQSEKTKAQLEEEELQRMIAEEEKAKAPNPKMSIQTPPKDVKDVAKEAGPQSIQESIPRPYVRPGGQIVFPEDDEKPKVDPKTIPEETKKKILNNKQARELAQGYINSFEADPQLKDNARFWELLRNKAIKKVGAPMRDESPQLEPFDDKRAAVFSAQLFPSTKFMNHTVAFVEQAEGIETLERLATKQNPFQKGLARYVAWRKKHPLPKNKRKPVAVSKEAVAVGKLLGGKKDGTPPPQPAKKGAKKQIAKKAVQSKARGKKKGK